MIDSKNRKKRIKVRIENPGAACGYVDHMTVDELKERLTGDDITLACPACGLVHLSRQEIVDLKKEKIIDSQQYRQMKSDAEGDENPK